jgi:hypothetical protein
MKEHEQDPSHIPIICNKMDQRMKEWDSMYMAQLQTGPFRVSGHGHIVVLCSDLNTSCKLCKTPIPSKQGRHFGYQCAHGCDFSLCVSCFCKQRLFRSKLQNIQQNIQNIQNI